MKLLHIDIETRPILAYVWRLFGNDSISVDQIKDPTALLCFSAKWHGEKDIMYHSAKNVGTQEYRRMVKKAHDLLSEADAVCHYNGTTFDVPRLNQEFLLQDLPPPAPFQQVDLKRVVSGKFDFTSSKLAFIGPILDCGGKLKNEGWALWRGCLDGDARSWEKMEEYNRQDVVLLEKVYNKLLPWIDQHPNMNMFSDLGRPVCPNCGEATLQSRGVYRTVTQEYSRFSCTNCGRWSRARKASKMERAIEVR